MCSGGHSLWRAADTEEPARCPVSGCRHGLFANPIPNISAMKEIARQERLRAAGAPKP